MKYGSGEKNDEKLRLSLKQSSPKANCSLPFSNVPAAGLRCSHFEPIAAERAAERLPCVVYLHGNCSSRLEALSTLPVLLPFNITVFSLDFAGSGLSDGECSSRFRPKEALKEAKRARRW